MKLPDDPACYDLPLSREFTHTIAQSYRITARLWGMSNQSKYMCNIPVYRKLITLFLSLSLSPFLSAALRQRRTERERESESLRQIERKERNHCSAVISDNEIQGKISGKLCHGLSRLAIMISTNEYIL